MSDQPNTLTLDKNDLGHLFWALSRLRSHPLTSGSAAKTERLERMINWIWDIQQRGNVVEMVEKDGDP